MGCCFFTLLLLKACVFTGHEKHESKPGVAVVVDVIQKKDVPFYLNTIGTVTSLDSVNVKTQVNGRLMKILFQEGQLVRKGQLLAQIDAQPYEAQLKQYEGQLLKDQALLDNARLDLKRYQKLLKEDSVSRQVLDTQVYLVKQYEGNVKTDEGLVEGVKVNLQYCNIISDIDGIAGLQQVNEGNYVQTTDTTPLTVVNAINPIAVVFPLPEDDLMPVQSQFRKRGALTVDAFDRKGETVLETGELKAIDSQIDPTTGTVNLKALFNNENFRLYANQFVNVRLKVDTLKDALVVPTAAIQMGNQGSFIYMVDDRAKTVSAKFIDIKTTVGEESAIMGSIREGQTIVIQGQDKLTEGTSVAPVKKEAAVNTPAEKQSVEMQHAP